MNVTVGGRETIRRGPCRTGLDPETGDTVVTSRRKKQRGPRELDLAGMPVIRVIQELLALMLCMSSLRLTRLS